MRRHASCNHTALCIAVVHWRLLAVSRSRDRKARAPCPVDLTFCCSQWQCTACRWGCTGACLPCPGREAGRQECAVRSTSLRISALRCASPRDALPFACHLQVEGRVGANSLSDPRGLLFRIITLCCALLHVQYRLRTKLQAQPYVSLH